MSCEWLKGHCLACSGAVRDWKDEWQANRYLIGKMFALQGEDATGRPNVTGQTAARGRGVPEAEVP